MGLGRLVVFMENHIGIGFRWRFKGYYALELSISIMFITLNIGLGKKY